MIIIAPPDRPQIAAQKPPASPAQPRLNWQDELLLQQLRDAGECATWSLLNAVVNSQCPRDRKAGRLLGLELLGRLSRLIELGLAFPVGRNWISATKPDPSKRQPPRRRQHRTVAEGRSVRAVSAAPLAEPHQTAQVADQDHFQVVSCKAGPQSPNCDATKTESDLSPEMASESARQLARLPRHPKRVWSGWIGSKRTFCGMRIVLPNGDGVFVFGALRGRVVWSRKPGDLVDPIDGIHTIWGVLPAHQVRITRNEHAVALGKRKAGVKESPSPRKQAAARANGSRPCRPGKRRGRPRTKSSSVDHLAS